MSFAKPTDHCFKFSLACPTKRPFDSINRNGTYLEDLDVPAGVGQLGSELGLAGKALLQQLLLLRQIRLALG